MSGPGKFEIEWIDRGHPPRNAPVQKGPVDLDVSGGAQRTCTVQLPYPTGHENVGGWLVRCLTCGMTGLVTAASRADDPRSVKVACKEQLQ